MVKNGTWFDPTMVGYEDSIDAKGPEIGKLRRTAFAAMDVLMQRAVRSSVPMLTGTDVLERHGERLLHELDLLVSVGMSPKEVLAAATVNSAAALGRNGSGPNRDRRAGFASSRRRRSLADIGNLQTLDGRASWQTAGFRRAGTPQGFEAPMTVVKSAFQFGAHFRKWCSFGGGGEIVYSIQVLGREIQNYQFLIEDER